MYTTVSPTLTAQIRATFYLTWQFASTLVYYSAKSSTHERSIALLLRVDTTVLMEQGVDWTEAVVRLGLKLRADGPWCHYILVQGEC